MPRISGVDIPSQKRTEIALTYIYGVGPTKARQVLSATEVNPDKRAKDLTGEEIQKLAKEIGKFPHEGDLKKRIRDNIDRLKHIGSYRGSRHTHNLPVRGQRTRTNARTKRGKRVTIGALKKEQAAKLQQAKKPESTAKSTK